MSAESQAVSLLRSGYKETLEFKHWKVGQRVRHHGQRYWQAYEQGTANIERIFVRDDGRDIELIVKRDKPQFGPDDTHGYWADYHTAIVRP